MRHNASGQAASQPHRCSSIGLAQVAIREMGGIAPLIEMAQAGTTPAQREKAVGAILKLTFNQINQQV